MQKAFNDHQLMKTLVEETVKMRSKDDEEMLSEAQKQQKKEVLAKQEKM